MAIVQAPGGTLYYSNTTTADPCYHWNKLATIDDFTITASSTGYPSIQLDINPNNYQMITKLLSFINFNFKEISKIKILNPNKVVLFTFSDGTTEKTICNKNDVFDLEFACYLALAKRTFKKEITSDGLELIANLLRYYKPSNKIVNKALKNYLKEIKLQKALEKQEKENKEIQQRKHEKNIKRKKKLREWKYKELLSLAEKLNIKQ